MKHGNEHSAQDRVRIRTPQPRAPSLAAFVVSVLAATALLACRVPTAISSEIEALPLMSEAIPLRSDEPGAREIGGLTWRGGLELRSPHPAFGGLSGLLISPEGAHLTAVSDKGAWLSFPLRYGADGTLIGVGEGRTAALRGLDGAVLAEKWDRDAEELALTPDGAVIVTFEHNHRLWRYPDLSGTPRALTPPPGLADLSGNSGIEALAGFEHGDLLAIAEGPEREGDSTAYLWREGAWSRLTYRREGGFRPTGATMLPDGDILVVERFFNLLEGVKIRLVRISAASVHPGARLKGTIIATLEPPVSLDNIEGVAARRSDMGETLIYLISDDNFNPLQRTLLLLFALPGPASK